jgi:hypothetical protein
MLTENASFFVYRDRRQKPTALASPDVEFELIGQNHSFFGWAARNGRPIDRRELYEEDAIRAVTTIGTSCIRVDGSDLTYLINHPIEVILSLAVYLHDKVYPCEVGVKWVLGRLKFDVIPHSRDLAGISVCIEKVIGNKYSRAGVTANSGVRLGELNFTAKKLLENSLNEH